MPPLYLVQQNAKLRLENRRLRVELEGEQLASLPLGHVSQVVLFGNIGLTTPTIHALFAQDTEVVFLSQDGAYLGRMLSSLTPHVPLRRAQYAHLGDPDFVLEMARGFVRAKFTHQRTLLLRHNRELHDPDIASAAEAMQRGMDSLPGAGSLPVLLGVEGATTRAYFRGYRDFFGPEWRFTDRNRRPPRDPINVLLSLGYTLLGQLAFSAIQVAGLDPYAGFLHDYTYNRPGLSLDLMEEFRAVVEGLVLWCCRGGQITPADFTPGPADRPVILSETGLKRYLQAFEQRFDQKFTHPLRGQQFPLRQCLIEQARQVAGRILNHQPGYHDMGWR